MTEFFNLLPVRFNRQSTLTISDGREIVKVVRGFNQVDDRPLGLRISFRVERKITALADTARIRVWNLNSDSRGMLAQRSLARVRRDPLRYAKLEAGYDDHFGTIFNGVIVRAINTREGPDWVTELECSAVFGQALLNTLSKSFGTATPVRNIVDELFAAAGWGSVHYSPEALEVISSILTKTKVVIGSAYNTASRLLKNHRLTFSVDVDGITVYKPDHPRVSGSESGTVPFLLLDESTGLVGTPKVTDFGADFKALLDPRIRPGQIVRIDSETLQESITDPRLGRDFTVYQVTCNGDTYTDDWFSEVANARFFPPEEQTSLQVLGPTTTWF